MNPTSTKFSTLLEQRTEQNHPKIVISFARIFQEFCLENSPDSFLRCYKCSRAILYLTMDISEEGNSLVSLDGILKGKGVLGEEYALQEDSHAAGLSNVRQLV